MGNYLHILISISLCCLFLIQIVELLLDRSEPRKLYNALLLAISLDQDEIPKAILKHPIYEKLERQQNIYSSNNFFLSVVGDDSQFTAETTPLILAAQRNRFEIVSLLIRKGHRIDKPHVYNCECTQCKAKVCELCLFEIYFSLTWGTNFCEFRIEIQKSYLTKMILKRYNFVSASVWLNIYSVHAIRYKHQLCFCAYRIRYLWGRIVYLCMFFKVGSHSWRPHDIPMSMEEPWQIWKYHPIIIKNTRNPRNLSTLMGI